MKQRFWIKFIASFLVITMLAEIAAGSVYALGEGPSQPEATQFEPVDTSDLVSLSTGDFVYNLPVMDVPGNEGNYPVSLSYHSGVNTNQEATWVGLGWSLNPGAINRSISGYPDDYMADKTETHYWAKTKRGWGVNLALGCGPVGMSMSYNSHGGFGMNAIVGMEVGGIGLNMSVGSDGISGGVSVGAKLAGNLSGSIGISAGTQGVGMSTGLSHGAGGIRSSAGLNFSSRGVGAYGGVSIPGERKETNGVSWSKPSFSLGGFSLGSGGGGANFSVAGGSITSMSSSNGGKFSSAGFSIPIPLPGNFWASIGFSKHKWKLNETFFEEAYGYIHQAEYHADSDDEVDKKYERQVTDKYIYPSQDFYTVSAQGISGSFMPFAKDPYFLWDGHKNGNKAKLKKENTYFPFSEQDPTFGPYSDNSQIRWRFLGDEGANLCVEAAGWSDMYANMYSDRFASKKIIPSISSETGKILGFTIIDTDGKIYEFMQPVLNIFQYSKTIDRKGTSDKTTFETYNIMGSPYATSWFITAIKGPDYVDRATTGIDENDWGYWVKFNYDKSDKYQIWRSPFKGFGPGGTSNDMENFAFGLREVVYLKSIETATHLAMFETSMAQDRLSSTDLTEIEIHRFIKTWGEPLKIQFLGKWTDLIAQTTRTDSLLYLRMRGYSSSSADHIDYQRFYLSKSQFTASYDANTNITEVTILANVKSWTDDGSTYTATSSKCIRSAVLRADRMLPPNQQLAKKLDRISLYLKNSTGVAKSNGVWTINASTAHSIKTTDFGYDYSLCRYTPSSMGFLKGKLTLTSVNMKGKDGTTYMPPYSFSYGDNPVYNEHDWDNWGSYRDPDWSAKDRGLYVHQTPQDKRRADNAAAWHLKNIQTPTGGNISVDYESDDYFSVSDFIDAEKFKNDYSIQMVSGQNNKFTCSDASVYNMDLKAGQYVRIKSRFTLYGMDFYKIYIITNIERSGGVSTLTLAQNHDWTPISGTNVSDYNYAASFYPRKVYGGGVRVKSIASSDGSNMYKTIYQYEENGFSTGVTASLPDLYTDDPKWFDKLDGDQKELNEKLNMDHSYSYGRPSPGVIYSKVIVMNVDPNNNSPLNGKTEFEFYTSKDFPFGGTRTDNYYVVADRSGIYGKPKATKQYEMVNGNQFRIVSNSSFVYKFSSELGASTRIVKDNDATVADAPAPLGSPLGLISEKYLFRNKYNSDASDIVRRYVTRQFENVYTYGSDSKSYFYSDTISIIPADSMSSLSRNFLRDALTGQILGTAVYKSDGKAEITKINPAYWIYSAMKDKNMLTPKVLESKYKTSLTASSPEADLKNYSFNADEMLVSTATTWSNHFDVDGDGQADAMLWRQNDVFVYNKQIDRGASSAFSAFNLWTYTSANYPAVTSDFPWKMTSNITKYDAYAHPVEEVNIDGTYTASVFGYDNALPILIAQNAKANEVAYYNYEKLTSSDAKTGRGSGSYSNGAQIYDDNNGFVRAPSAAGTYVATAWVKPSGSTDWQYYERTLTANQDFTVSGSSGLIDDIRIYPKKTTMSTFTYDPLTWKVTAICDANNIISYFEYDSGGRLVKSYDQDKNMIKKYTYQYKRN